MSVVMLPPDFPGDHPDGAEPLVAKVRAALGARFRGESLPRTVLVDRSVGFYNAGTGGITREFKAALADHGLKAFMGDDASQQPGRLWEMMLRETAVSWIRRGLTWSLPPRPWEESPIGYARRLRAVVRDINTHYNVEGLCMGIATTCPRPECGPGWHAGQMSERGVDPQKKGEASSHLPTTTPMREMSPF